MLPLQGHFNTFNFPIILSALTVTITTIGAAIIATPATTKSSMPLIR